MSNWLKIEYLFTNNMLPITDNVFNLGLSIYIVFLILGFVFTWVAKQQKFEPYKKKAFRMLMSWSTSFAIVGLLLMFLRHLRVPFLGMRGWTFIWWIIILIWFLYILRYILIDLPKLKEEIKAKKEFEKYLP